MGTLPSRDPGPAACEERRPPAAGTHTLRSDTETAEAGTGENLSANGLGQRVFAAARWSLGASVVMKIFGLAVSIVIARLLGPEEFGVVAVATVAQAALLSLNELGVSVALVRWQGNDRDVAPTVATLSTLGGLVCFAALVAAAPYVADTMGAPAATWPIRIMAVSLLLDGLVATPAALLQRHFMQARRAAADMSNFGASSVVAIVLALFGFGALALAIGRIAGSLASSAMLIRIAPQPLRFGWSPQHVRPLLQVGLPLAGASLIVFGILNIDYIVVGRSLGPVELGFYVLAFNLSTWPVTLLSQPVRSVALPAFARLTRAPERLAAVVVRGFAGLMSVTMPVAATLGALAWPLVHVVYGAEWQPAAPVLVWLAALGAARVALEFLYDLLVAVGASRQVFLLQVAWLASLAVALPLAAGRSGIVGVATAHAAVAFLLVIPLHLILISRRLRLRGLELMRRLTMPVLTTVAVIVVAVTCQRFLSPWPTLVLTGLVGGAVTLRAALQIRTALSGSDTTPTGTMTSDEASPVTETHDHPPVTTTVADRTAAGNPEGTRP